MATYKVLTPVDHDGERYEAGKSIELEDEHAKPLLAINAIAKKVKSAGKDAENASADAEISNEPAGE